MKKGYLKYSYEKKNLIILKFHMLLFCSPSLYMHPSATTFKTLTGEVNNFDVVADQCKWTQNYTPKTQHLSIPALSPCSTDYLQKGEVHIKSYSYKHLLNFSFRVKGL